MLPLGTLSGFKELLWRMAPVSLLSQSTLISSQPVGGALTDCYAAMLAIPRWW